MPGRPLSPQSAPVASRVLLGVVAAVCLVASLMTPWSAAASSATGASVDAAIAPATLEGFTPGNIISDSVLTNKNTMTEAQIQAFFDDKVKRCQGGSDSYGPIVCLKDFTITSVDRPADAYCTGYTGAANEKASRIIYRVAQACNINPQVLIVMLQKEQGLITHTWPSAWRYDKALGQGCPDDAPCNPAFVGFFHQIYGAARQLQIYMENKYFTWYSPGKTWNVRYHPNASCGTSPVYIENLATAALYYYTPYQPNAAALAAGTGTGDACSSYGNRNFYHYFTQWFGPTTVAAFTQASASIAGTPWVGQTLTATSTSTPAATTTTYQWYRNGQAISGATGAHFAVTLADAGRSFAVDVTVRRTGYADRVTRSAAIAVPAMTVDRTWGELREETAVSVSKAAWPSGASTVLLATSRDFADALSASAVGGRLGASLLLTRPDRLLPAVSAELRRLAPRTVIFAGGDGVLTPELEQQVRALLPAATIERPAGLTRWETSRKIVESVGSSSSLFVATGVDYPDALSAAAVGNATGAPVLLVNGTKGTIPAETLTTIKNIGAKTVTIVGGPGAVSTGIESQLRSQGITVKRLQGENRYLTNVAVNEAHFPTTALRGLVATGQDFPDALSATALAGRLASPLLLTFGGCVPEATLDFMADRGTERVTLVGGAGVLTPDGVAQLRSC